MRTPLVLFALVLASCGELTYLGPDADEPLPDTTTEPDDGREIVQVRSCTVTASQSFDWQPGTVEIAGEFNNWNPVAMTRSDGDGAWTVVLGEIGPGEYAYKLIIDGTWEGQPPTDVYTKWSGGTENRALRVGDCQLPLLQMVHGEATAAGALTATIQFGAAADGAALDLDALDVTVGGKRVEAQADPSTGEITIDTTGLVLGKHSIRVWAADVQGRRAENEPLFLPLWVEDEPFEWEDGAMYFAFVDRFRNGDWGEDTGFDPIYGVAECANYGGGDFLGIIHAIEEGYFESLGVRTLWLSPVYENPEGGYIGVDGNYYSGYHGYWPVQPLSVEARFGDISATGEDRLQELIDTAHAHGIRVLFDLVLNHVHEDHVYVDTNPEWFGNGCVCGEPGCGWDERAVDCWFMPYLPDLNYQNHDVLQQVMADTLRLVEFYDVDAVRVDAAKHMDHVAMRTLSMRLRDEYEAGGGAEFYLVGETFTSDRGLIMDYVDDTELDGQFDFPLYYAVRDAFAYGGSFSDLDAAVLAGEAAYGDGKMSPFIGNHDVERFATAVTGEAGWCWDGWTVDPMAGGDGITEWSVIDRSTLALAFVLTQPGVPLLYYGDEIGMHGAIDPDNRRTMSFDPYLSGNQSELLGRVRALGSARAESAALRRGGRRTLWVDDDLYVYARNTGSDVAIVALNKDWSPRTVDVPVGGLGLTGQTFDDTTHPRSFTVNGDSLHLELEAWDHAILVE